MEVRDGAAVRRKRLQALIDLIARHQEEPIWNRNRVIGTFMLQTGLTRARIDDYIQELIDVGLIRSEGDRLYSNI
jgi:predicted transcriptional regulator